MMARVYRPFTLNGHPGDLHGHSLCGNDEVCGKCHASDENFIHE